MPGLAAHSAGDRDLAVREHSLAHHCFVGNTQCEVWCAAQNVQAHKHIMDFENTVCWITLQGKKYTFIPSNC